MASVFWAVGARRDLRDIIEFISRDSTIYAVATSERVLDATERLREFPQLGRIVPEYEDPSIRELIVGNYRIVYRLRRKQVVIAAISHARRDLERRRREVPWDMG